MILLGEKVVEMRDSLLKLMEMHHWQNHLTNDSGPLSEFSSLENLNLADAYLEFVSVFFSVFEANEFKVWRRRLPIRESKIGTYKNDSMSANIGHYRAFKFLYDPRIWNLVSDRIAQSNLPPSSSPVFQQRFRWNSQYVKYVITHMEAYFSPRLITKVKEHAVEIARRIVEETKKEYEASKLLFNDRIPQHTQ